MSDSPRILPSDVEGAIEQLERLQRAYSETVGRDEERVARIRGETIAYIDALDPALRANPALDLTIRGTLAVMTQNWALLNPFKGRALLRFGTCGMALGVMWAAVMAGLVIPVLAIRLGIQRRRHRG